MFALASSWIFDLWGWRAPGCATKDGTGPLTLPAHILWEHSFPIPHTHIPHIPRILCPETPVAEKN